MASLVGTRSPSAPARTAGSPDSRQGALFFVVLDADDKAAGVPEPRSFCCDADAAQRVRSLAESGRVNLRA